MIFRGDFIYLLLKGKCINLNILSRIILLEIRKLNDDLFNEFKFDNEGKLIELTDEELQEFKLKEEQYKEKFKFKIKDLKNIILPVYVGYSFELYNGFKYIKLKIVEDYIGHKFGDFILTRSFIGHKKLYKRSKSKLRESKVKRNTRVLRDYAFFNVNIYLEKKKFL